MSLPVPFIELDRLLRIDERSDGPGISAMRRFASAVIALSIVVAAPLVVAVPYVGVTAVSLSLVMNYVHVRTTRIALVCGVGVALCLGTTGIAILWSTEADIGAPQAPARDALYDGFLTMLQWYAASCLLVAFAVAFVVLDEFSKKSLPGAPPP